MSTDLKMDARREVLEACRRMLEEGLVIGSSGNASKRIGDTDTVAITPSNVKYTDMAPEDILIINFDGDVLEGERNPSIEHRMHIAVYQARSDVGAMIHTHSIHASALAVLGIPLPPIIDEFVVYLGGQVEVAKYGLPGSDELARNAVEALGSRNAVLLANHGALCCGPTMDAALHNALLLERAARIYLLAAGAGRGEPKPIPGEALSTQQELFELMKRMKRRR